MKFKTPSARALAAFIRPAALAACVGLVLIAPCASWAGDDDDDDPPTGNSMFLNNMRDVMRSMQDNQAVINRIKAQTEEQREENAQRIADFEAQQRAKQEAAYEAQRQRAAEQAANQAEQQRAAQEAAYEAQQQRAAQQAAYQAEQQRRAAQQAAYQAEARAQAQAAANQARQQWASSPTYSPSSDLTSFGSTAPATAAPSPGTPAVDDSCDGCALVH
jgi:colicin import membrane protein